VENIAALRRDVDRFNAELGRLLEMSQLNPLAKSAAAVQLKRWHELERRMLALIEAQAGELAAATELTARLERCAESAVCPLK
jgi:hypothetical protein